MVSSSKSIIRIAEYYKQVVVGKKSRSLIEGDIKISEWIGDFQPENLRLIPLCEDKDSILNSAQITEDFIEYEKVKDYQRVWIARSDPALNYGSLPAVILAKIAMQRLHALSERSSVDILPILGCGSTPFRGNFKPTNIRQSLAEFPSVSTFTIQSAFKYDYPEPTILKAVEEANSSQVNKPIPIDEAPLLDLFEKVSQEYSKEIQLISSIVNEFSGLIPERRKRKLHIGLFGYSRSHKGITLPRAIPFCASLYSLGLPPEILGISALSSKDLELIHSFYPGFRDELVESFSYYNQAAGSVFDNALIKRVEKAKKLIESEPCIEHNALTTQIIDGFKKKNHRSIQEHILEAGNIRGFLG
jgi:phosphoenolpyruvate carboxylase